MKGVDAEYFQFVKGLIKMHPDVYIGELQDQVLSELKKEISQSTLSRELMKMGITNKKVG